MFVDSPLAQLRNYARVTWRFRWVALFLAAFICGIGWVVVMTLPNTYEVTARVYLDTTSSLRPALKDIAVNSQEQATASLVSRTLLVRPNLEAVARKTDMDLEVTTPKQFELLIDGLAKAIRVGTTHRSNIFNISYTADDPKRTYRVVEALLNIFVERSLGESRRDTSSTRQFIEEQIKEYEARLLAAEARQKEFKRQNAGVMPSDGRSYFHRLDDLASKVSEARLQLNESQRRVKSLQEQLEGVPQAFRPSRTYRGQENFLTSKIVVDPMVDRIDKMQQRLDSLLVMYRERHPDVIATRQALEALEKEYEAKREAAKAAAKKEANGDIDLAAEETVPNPLFQEIKVALGSAQADSAALQARVDEYQRRQEDLRKLVDTVPKVEAELARLNRDYTIDKDNYDKLVQRREALKISDEASQSADDVRFNVIEPPREPIVPVGPKRVLLSAGVLVIGLGGGLGIAFLVGLLKPAFYSRDDCENVTELPVLGVVTRVWTRGELFRRRMEVATFALGCVALVAVCGAVMVLHHFYSDVFNDLNISARLVSLKDRLL